MCIDKPGQTPDYDCQCTNLYTGQQCTSMIFINNVTVNVQFYKKGGKKHLHSNAEIILELLLF